ncbi:Gfo/Idh/MocA family oxidoreductase [Terribacillus halophilus]|uniref:Gfo/Idh/MocA family oxidoreductase n=1 Tax=Terribacillus halophilus TaxID=361279 RepID=UPI003566AC8C
MRVTFNYRYAPHNTKIKELISSGVIGQVNSVHFEWALDTKHGADYFRRWHRDKRNSGGLLVHKSTHHFDLVNFWLDTTPERVYAVGDLLFYGKENAEQRGETNFYQRAHQSDLAKEDPFAIDLANNVHLKAMYLDAEKEDGYQRDQSVFGDGISIEDTLGVLVNYKNKSILTYSLNAYLPWEGFRVSFNGTKGRIDAHIIEKSYVNSGGKKAEEGQLEQLSIIVSPMFDMPYEVEVETTEGGHGGGDTALLEDLFGKPQPDVFKRAASHVDGAMSIMTGIAGNLSLRTGNAVTIKDLIKL